MVLARMFSNTYQGKKVLITGHTGFKGSWLCTWLLEMGAEVIGFSNEIPTNPSMFEALSLENRIHHTIGDIRDLGRIATLIDGEKPDFIFHLAAQAIVSRSYSDPVNTLTTNTIGTVNVLEALRLANFPCVAVLITSDKCYENVEWEWGYRENDRLGGKDIYSGSKAAAEVAIHAYYHSFFSREDCPIVLGRARAGNVIGGGDWAQDRLVADCVRSWHAGETVEIRSPTSTRPWQHVLEPLSGYLSLGKSLATKSINSGDDYNFGPKSEQNRTVVELIEDLAHIWGFENSKNAYRVTDNIPFHEAGLLKLNCDKALLRLRWEPTLEYKESISLLGEWYKNFYNNEGDMSAVTKDQIFTYASLARSRGREWAQD